MVKKTIAESDEAKLKEKVKAKLTGHKAPQGDAPLRSLRKRLKRAQRKRRALTLRKKRAAGKIPEATAQTAG